MIDTNFLSTISIFSTLSKSDLETLARNFTICEKKENDIIFKKGDPGESIYIIQEGHIQISLTAINGEELILAILHKGDFFGELTMFDQTERTASAIVYDHAILLEMPRAKFIALLKSHPDIAISMLATMGKRLRQTNDIMQKQTTRNVNDEMENELSFGDRVADKFSDLLGSWTFIIWFTILLWVWIILNVYTIFFVPVDPYPFILLNLILSCLAAIQAPVIMMSQGRQAKKDKIQADMDYKINLKAELQIQDIRANIDKINKHQVKLNKEIRHDQVEIIKTQHRILEKLGDKPA
jgi:uncharacterized membrane protein